MTATTALTAQNTLGVYGIHPIPTAFLKQQLDACFDDIGVDVVKTGMLASAATIDLVADTLKQRAVAKAVVDPVMVATTGASLLPADATASFTNLARLAYVLTPNLPELRKLLNCSDDVACVADLERLAQVARQRLGPTWLLAKGGHLPFKKNHEVARTDQEREVIVNVLVGPDGQSYQIESDYQNSRNTHGTGCSLASAIASNLAKGMDVYPAVKAACRYIEAAIRYAPDLGRGHGPLNHFHSVSSLPFSRGHFLEYVLNRPDVAGLWHRFVNHPFVKALGSGSLPMESFKGYLIQDYLYLGAALVQQLENEMRLHVQFCADFGISRDDMEAAEEKTACTAYSRYVLDIGQSEDWFALQIALTPCVVGYGAAARAIHEDRDATKRDGNPYLKWVQNYVDDNYLAAAKTTMDLIEEHAVLQSPSRIEELVEIFKHSTKMEIAFWEMYSFESDAGKGTHEE
ncbi:phosphomethylpyrimidine kinase [Niveomyces insectorum RCEF 264]|uniref:Phosphomethylpyrimidine kinase n=1 Tax=Niveomyces insectorum RCEF 264 TaxID=1081102 RepID=A0A162MU93_9HYPO|nr:phosphomethylpyrimidine kinase [Niveomyces insectorum RCEF 264]